jgi:hypothetical protein
VVLISYDVGPVDRVDASALDVPVDLPQPERDAGFDVGFDVGFDSGPVVVDVPVDLGPPCPEGTACDPASCAASASTAAPAP